MKPSEFIKILPFPISQKMPVLVQSAPGIGKSQMIREFAKTNGYDLITCFPGIEEPTEIKGFPFVFTDPKTGEKLADFLAYGQLQKMLTAKVKTIVFIDDIGLASQSMQGAYAQPLESRLVNGKRISEHVSFIAATNSAKHCAGVSGLISMLLSRFTGGIFELETSASDWQNWAKVNGMPPELIAFVGFRENLMHTFKPSMVREIANYACPRTLEALGRWLNHCPDLSPEVVRAVVGEEFAIEFCAFLSIYRAIGNLIPEIVRNPLTAKTVSDQSHIYAVFAALAQGVTVKTLPAYLTYLNRYSANEFMSFFWHIAKNRESEKGKQGEGFRIANSAEYQAYILANPGMLV